MKTPLTRLLYTIAAAFSLGIIAASTAAADEAQPAKAAAKVVAALDNIASISRPGRVGYATIWSYNQYIQCRRLPTQDWRCEAAGTLMQPSLKRVLTPERITQLETTGWLLDPAFGNYAHTFPASMATSTIAAAIVATLTGIYGAKPDTIETATDWVADVTCPPRHGPTQNLAGMISDDPAVRNQLIRTCAYQPSPELAVGEPLPSLDALQKTYGPLVNAELNRLWINRSKRVFVVFDPGLGYIQCMPDRDPEGFYCEAQSEDSYPALAALLDEKRKAILHDAGFADPGETPNYWKRYSAGDHTTTDIAQDILKILHDVYGYRGATKLKVKTERG